MFIDIDGKRVAYYISIGNIGNGYSAAIPGTVDLDIDVSYDMQSLIPVKPITDGQFQETVLEKVKEQQIAKEYHFW